MSHRKRSRGEYEADLQQGNSGSFSVGDTLSRLDGDHASGRLTPESPASPQANAAADAGWHDVETKSAKRTRKKRAKEEMKKRESDQKGEKRSTYPAITHAAHARLSSHVKVTDLQQLVLYLTADGPAPQWVAVSHRAQLRKVVVLMVPGIELGMFDGSVPLLDATVNGPSQPNVDLMSNGHEMAQQYMQSAPVNISGANERSMQDEKYRSPDEFYPQPLAGPALQVPLKPLAKIFPHVWPIQCPGDSRTCRIYSPLSSVLNVPLPKNKEEQQQKGVKPAREAKNWQNDPTPIAGYLASADDLTENNYVVHESLLLDEESKRAERDKREKNEQTAEHGWIDTGSERAMQDPTSKRTTPSLDAVAEGHVDKPPPPLHSPTSKPEQQPPTPQTSVPFPITLPQISDPLTSSRPILALDCEMCATGPTRFELTRISILSWTGDILLDTLVKPPNPITDYLTAYSGITAEKLAPITTTLQDIQCLLLSFITTHPSTILLGHSLNSDLAALKLVHPHIVDTSLLYPHPGGSHLRSSLKWLSQKYLSRHIQQGGGSKGHDSIEDARAALDLVKQKCKRGPAWGTSEATQESIFRRIQRTPRSGAGGSGGEKTGGLVDFGVPKRGHGAAADVCIGCRTDEEVVAGVRKMVNGDATIEGLPGEGVDFTWARLRELEAVRGFWAESKTEDVDALRKEAVERAVAAAVAAGGRGAGEVPKLVDIDAEETALHSKPTETDILRAATARTVSHISQIYEALPKCTAFIVYSGTGDPREMRRLQEMQTRFKKEYQVKRWSEIETKWTDREEQELRRAYGRARGGVGFLTVK